MRSARNVRVLMLGWEYPPRYAGGLGKACQGLSQGMAKLGAQVFFVLPSFPRRVSEKHLEVLGAQEILIEAGWDPQITRGGGQTQTPETERVDRGRVDIQEVGAKLFPYGEHPAGEMPETLRRVIHRMGEKAPISRIREVRRKESAQPFLRPKPVPPAAEQTQTEEMGPISSEEIYGKNLWSEIERYCFTVRHMMEAHEVDLVHAHDWMTFPAAFEVHRTLGVPVFLHVHATEYDRSGENLNQEVFRIEREGFRSADHIFAVSRYTAGIIERLYGIDRRKISVAYNAPEERKQLQGEEATRKLQVVFLGRMTFQKGPDHFLKAAALVKAADSRVRFILCGTGDMVDKLRHQAQRLGIADQVEFTGFLDPSAVDKILMMSKVLVMPSVSEPFGLVALEAIRCKIPVIISKQSGVREVLYRALQVDFWDHEKLADQILAALRLPELSKQLVEEGVDQLRQLSWEKSAQHVMEVYRKQLGSIYAQQIGGAHGH